MDVRIRPLAETDLPAVQVIFRAHTGASPPPAWGERLGLLLVREHTVARVAEDLDSAVVGYIVGEIRSWEFGSEPAGWIYAIGVDPDHHGRGVGAHLVADVTRSFVAMGVHTLRTMVGRDDVSVLRFFRHLGFGAGPYTELELELEVGGRR